MFLIIRIDISTRICYIALGTLRPVPAYAAATQFAATCDGNVGLWQFTYALFSAATAGGTVAVRAASPRFFVKGRRASRRSRTPGA
jgi:hypothetical protein